MARKIVSFMYDDGTVTKVTASMQVIVDDSTSDKIITQGAGDSVKLIDRGNTYARLRKLEAELRGVLS